MWLHKWRSQHILVEIANRFERVEIPVYRSAGGPLFKTLLSSACRMDCRYCPLSTYCRIPRHVWDRRKLVRVFLEAYRKGIVRGLFLSSSLYGDPERVVEDMIEVVEELRRKGYKGYIHLRLMPGTPPHLIRYAAKIATRIGLNLEAPTPSHFVEIAPSKGGWSTDLLAKLLYAARVAGNPDRVDTQLVVGASGETDREILALVESLTGNGVGKIHFSPYIPIPGTPLAAKRRRGTPKWRSRLLYEAWALIRFYGFTLKDIEPVLDDKGMLPKTLRRLKDVIAEAHPEWFPVDVNNASLRELLRVPGIGIRRARRILEVRRVKGRLKPDDVRKIVGLSAWRKAVKYLAF